MAQVAFDAAKMGTCMDDMDVLWISRRKSGFIKAENINRGEKTYPQLLRV